MVGLRDYYGRAIGPSFKAIVGILDGEPIGVGGIAYAGGLCIAFCDLKPIAKRYRIALHRAACAILVEEKRRSAVIFAEANSDEPTAVRWLTRLGFEHVHGNLWQWRRAKTDGGRRIRMTEPRD